ncbi:hypothetical protein BH09MYX1_BH09MYX1_35560 [soil metagenome]
MIIARVVRRFVIGDDALMRLHRISLVALVISVGCSADGTTPELDAGSSGDASLDVSALDVVAQADTASSDAVSDSPIGRDLSSDRTKFFGASRCGTAGLLLCDDFESGTLDTSTWKVTGTAPKIDAVNAARGTKALHVSITGNGASYIKETKTFPIANDTYWGRMFVYFHQQPKAPMTYSHWTFAGATGTGVTGEIRLSGQLQNGKNLFGVGTDSGNDPNGTGDWTSSDKDNGPKMVPLDEWLCIEWMNDGAKSETRFYWDATEHASLFTSKTVHGGNTKPYLFPQFTAQWVGWQEYQASTLPFELWIDEVAIDGARIGCIQ